MRIRKIGKGATALMIGILLGAGATLGYIYYVEPMIKPVDFNGMWWMVSGDEFGFMEFNGAVVKAWSGGPALFGTIVLAGDTNGNGMKEITITFEEPVIFDYRGESIGKGYMISLYSIGDPSIDDFVLYYMGPVGFFNPTP